MTRRRRSDRCASFSAPPASGPEPLERRACPAVVSVSAPAEVDETAGQTEMLITLSQPVAASTSVQYTFRNGPGSAIFGRDYAVSLDGRQLGSAGALTFRPGQTSLTLRVDVVNDGLVENVEAFTLTLFSPRGLTLGARQASVAINDAGAGTPGSGPGTPGGGSGGGDPVSPPTRSLPTLQITAAATVAEAGGRSTVQVTLSQPASRPVTVGYSITPLRTTELQPATYGIDYMLNLAGRRLPATGTLTFRPGQTALALDLTVNNDRAREGDEAFTVSLQRPSGAALDPVAQAAAVTIDDDDDYTVSIFGSSPIAAGQPNDFLVELSSPATQREIFYATTINGTATAGRDYHPLFRAPVVIQPGQTTGRLRIVTIADDPANQEYDETFSIRLQPLSPGFPAPTPDFPVMIAGPLGPRPPEISITDSAFVREGSAGFTQIRLTAKATGSWSTPISFQYATRDGSASIADSDYVGASGTIAFAPGTTEQTITVSIIGDTKAEEGESLFVDFSSPVGAILASTSAIVTIVNDDDRPAEPYYDNEYGYGLVDASAAVAHHLGLNSPFPAEPELGGNEWGNDLINAPAVWAQGYTGKGTVVAVIDTGVDYTHPDLYRSIWINQGEIPANLRKGLTDTDRDGIVTFRDLNEPANTGFVTDVNRNGYIDAGDLLADARWASGGDADSNGYRSDLIGWNFVARNSRPQDYDDHGTHVAGTIGAMRNSIGHTGVAHDALIMPIASLGADGGTARDVADGIRYAAANGAHVINLSLGGGFSNDMEAAIAFATSRGVIVVAASGNDGANRPGFPASLATMPGVISVGAVDRTRTIARFSNWAGPDSALKHVMAPGVDVFSTIPGGGYASISGTSMATPHVAGVVALMLSVRTTTDIAGRDAVVDAIVDTSRRATSGRMAVNRAALFAAVGSLPGRMFTASVAAEATLPKSRFSLVCDSSGR